MMRIGLGDTEESGDNEEDERVKGFEPLPTGWKPVVLTTNTIHAHGR